MAFKFANFFVGELIQQATSGDTTLIVTPSAAAKLPEILEGSDDEIRLVLWDGQNEPEIVGCVENDFTGALTVVRGQEDTTQQSWGPGTQIVSALTKEVVEEALSAIVDVTSVGDVRYVRKQGDVMTGHLGLPSGTPATTQAVRRDYLESLITGFVQTSGFTMAGNINMNSQRIIGLLAALVDSEPATYGQLQDVEEELQNRLKDVSGELITTGTAAAYVLTTASTVGALIDGLRVSFRPHATNTSGATLNVNSLGAKQLRTITGVNLTPDVLMANMPYSAVYNASADVWYLEGLYGLWRAPPAGIMSYAGSVAPFGSFFPYGQVYSQTTYAGLYAAIGTTFNTGGEGAENFRVPDLQGRLVAYRDNLSGVAASRITTAGGGVDGASLGAIGGQQSRLISQGNIPSYTLPNTLGVVGTVTSNSAYRALNLVNSIGGGTLANNMLQNNNVDGPTYTFSGSITGSVTSGGSGTALQTLPPIIILNPIMKY